MRRMLAANRHVRLPPGQAAQTLAVAFRRLPQSALECVTTRIVLIYRFHNLRLLELLTVKADRARTADEPALQQPVVGFSFLKSGNSCVADDGD